MHRHDKLIKRPIKAGMTILNGPEQREKSQRGMQPDAEKHGETPKGIQIVPAPGRGFDGGRGALGDFGGHSGAGSASC